MRRFFVPDKEKCEAFLRAQKMWWSEAWEPLGDLAERNPNRRIGGLRIQSCYMPFVLVIYAQSPLPASNKKSSSYLL